MKSNWIGELLDTAFSLLGKSGRVLNNYGKRICFLIWIVCAAYWAIRDLYLCLYSQAFFCTISIFLHLHGFLNGNKKESND